MTDPVVSSYPGYATPTFTHFGDCWIVGAACGNTYQDWTQVGLTEKCDAGWTAHSNRGAYVGLFPDKQAAGEALVKHAGYEVLR